MDGFLSSNIPGSRNFLWKDALWLPKWQIFCIPTDQQGMEISKICFKLEQIRDFFGKEIKINSWMRPKAYNELIGGAKDSAHIYGMAVDFTVDGMICDDVRAQLETRLDSMKIRMERMPGGNWIHVDNRDAGPKNNRYFKP